MQKLSFWEVDGYDKPTGYAYSRIFNQITGGTTTTPPSAAGTITGIGGKCVDVKAAATADGTPVQLYTCNGTAAQSWTYNASTHDIVNPQANRCLDATGQSSADGTRLQIWTCTGTANQKWAVNG